MSSSSSSSESPSAKITPLYRGGVVIQSSLGNIQIGIPPESIKDSMLAGLEMPKYWVIVENRFDPFSNLSVAEFEFPAYFSFFVRREQVTLVTTAEGEERCRMIFQETFLGPRNLSLDSEVASDYPKENLPDLAKEINYFAHNPFKPSEMMNVDSLLTFKLFNENTNAVTITDTNADGEEVTVEIKKVLEYALDGSISLEEYHIYENGKFLGMGSGSIEHNQFYEHTNYYFQVMRAQFTPPLFAITMLGTSHGFDPKGTTTGFILWMNRRGVMIDPPPNSGHILRLNGIPSRLIDGVILTHCHADHDAGTFQRILEEHQITVITTPLIMKSFLRKYSAVSGMSINFLKSLFSFRAVKLGARLTVHGGELNFFYSLHSIPCVGFEAYYADKSLVYSADTLNDPERITKMQEDGVLSEGRANSLINFPWHHDLILHEAGVPPLHTPLTTLMALPDDVKERLWAVHVAEKDVKESGLNHPKAGPENTIHLEVESIDNSQSIEVLDLASGLHIFNQLNLKSAKKLLEMCKTKQYARGEVITERDEAVESFSIIALGIVSLNREHSVARQLSIGDYFGGTTVVDGQGSPFTVQAETDVTLVTLSRNDFTHLLSNITVHPLSDTLVLDRLSDQNSSRELGSYELISNHTVFEALSTSQQAHLDFMLQLCEFDEGQVVWRKHQEAPCALFVFEGTFEVSSEEDIAHDCDVGCLVGDFEAIARPATFKARTTCVATSPGRSWKIDACELRAFFKQNPGVLLPFIGKQWVD